MIQAVNNNSVSSFNTTSLLQQNLALEQLLMLANWSERQYTTIAFQLRLSKYHPKLTKSWYSTFAICLVTKFHPHNLCHIRLKMFADNPSVATIVVRNYCYYCVVVAQQLALTGSALGGWEQSMKVISIGCLTMQCPKQATQPTTLTAIIIEGWQA